MQTAVKNFACKLQESMSKLSECELINRFLSNTRQVCYIFEFKVNQEDFTRSFIFVNDLKKNFE